MADSYNRDSLVQFAEERQRRQNLPVFWGRREADGAPFRGASPPMMSEREFEARTTRVAQPRAAYFDTQKQEELDKYISVLEGAANGVFQLLFIERHYRPYTHYVEWLEYYIEQKDNPLLGDNVYARS